MKKILLFIILLIPFFVYAEDFCNKNDIKIESITLEETQGNIEETSSPTTTNNQVNLGLKMNVIDDAITYKLVIKNTSNQDYTFDKNSLSTEYLNYDIIYEDNSDIVKAGESKTIYLTVNYSNKPSTENLSNGVLTDTPKVSFELAKEQENIIEEIKNIVNPNTIDKIGIYLIVLIISIILITILLRKHKKIRNTTMLIIVLIITPQIVKATCTCTLDINTNLEIDAKEAFFLSGTKLNIKMKELAGTYASEEDHLYTVYDGNIKKIIRSENEPDNSNKQEENIVSISDSPYPIYMWFDNRTIYWWSEDKTPSLRPNSTCMFFALTNLTDISGLETFDTSNVISMRAMFNITNSLGDISYLSNWITNNVTDMAYLFSMSSITSLDGLAKWNTSNVEHLEFGFNQSEKLANMDGIKNWDVSKVTIFRQLFCGDVSLEEVDLSNWDTSSVTNMVNMFGMWKQNGASRKDSKLKRINISGKFNTSNVEDMSLAFVNLVLVEEIIGIEDLDTSKVTDMQWMFLSCEKITNLDLHKWNTSNVDDMTYMFEYMPNLEVLDISGFDTRNVTSFKRMFYGSDKLKHIYVGENWDTSANTGETTYVFPSSSQLPNFDSSDSTRQNISHAHTGEGGYLELKPNE